MKIGNVSLHTWQSITGPKRIVSGTRFRQGDIVLVAMPFTNLKGVKKRPALVISNDEYNERTDDLVICRITSDTNPVPYSILLRDDSLQFGVLSFTSKIRADKLFTIHNSLIQHRLGRVTERVLDDVRYLLGKLVS
jgi:mRNA interferase MazF